MGLERERWRWHLASAELRAEPRALTPYLALTSGTTCLAPSSWRKLLGKGGMVACCGGNSGHHCPGLGPRGAGPT